MTEGLTQTRMEQTRFDVADRDRLRRVLLRYMEENRIGVPTLQKLVAEANDLALDRLPLKTLQRFLADTHRSNDIMVRFCHRFAESLPDDDPLTSLGEGLTGFWGGAADIMAWEALTADVFGIYTGHAKEDGAPLQLDRKWVPFSSLEVERVPAQSFARARETVTNWAASNKAKVDSALRRSYDGILFRPPGALLALMRNALTGAPRLYWLERPANNQLAGYGHEGVSGVEDRQLSTNAFNTTLVIFERIDGGGAS